jgi:hypothetical protein
VRPRADALLRKASVHAHIRSKEADVDTALAISLIDPRVCNSYARLGLAHVGPRRYRCRRRGYRIHAPRDEHLERLTQQQRFVG